MYTASRQGINAYARVGLETGVIAASPHRLILMLFEGARVALSSALVHMKNGETVAKGESLSKAISIISSGLQASLDVNAGGELAQHLYALYDYMSRRLLLANLHNNPEYVEEVAGLLAELSGAWEMIGTAAGWRAITSRRDSILRRCHHRRKGVMTMTSVEAIAAFASISTFTGEMTEAARAGEWDRLAALEGRCAAVVATLKAAAPLQLPPEMQRQKVELIQKILADDAEIRRYTEPWMHKVQTLLGSAGMTRRLRQAYDPGTLGNL